MPLPRVRSRALLVGLVALLLPWPGLARPQLSGRAPAQLQALARFGRGPASSASFFEPLRDPRRAFQRRLQLIDGARQSLIGTLYAVDLDGYGDQFLDALIRAARRGVKVAVGIDRTAQLVYDVRASRAARRGFRQKVRALEAAGGMVGWYGGLAVQLRRPGSGIHFKSLVADGREAIMDGRNIGHEYFERWSDFGGRLRGPVVSEIAGEALRLLHRCKPARGLHLDRAGARRARYRALLQEVAAGLASRPPSPGGRTPVALVAWDPLGDEGTFLPRGNQITRALTHAVGRARREITISSNFLHAARPLRQALMAAARRGVRVRLITTGEAASEVSRLPYLITSAHYGKLVEAGCEIYETTRMEHGKMYLIDGRAGFGSYNASKISDGRNAEALLFSTDPAIVSSVRGALEETLRERGVRYQPRPPASLGDRLRRAVQWPLRMLTL